MTAGRHQNPGPPNPLFGAAPAPARHNASARRMLRELTLEHLSRLRWGRPTMRPVPMSWPAVEDAPRPLGVYGWWRGGYGPPRSNYRRAVAAT
jgi:hypothetical protein